MAARGEDISMAGYSGIVVRDGMQRVLVGRSVTRWGTDGRDGGLWANGEDGDKHTGRKANSKLKMLAGDRLTAQAGVRW
jgi:hypothetical protein